MIKNNFKLFSILLVLLIFAIQFLNAQNNNPLRQAEQQEVLNTITQKLSDVKNLKADFKQIRHMDILTEPLVSVGICYFEEPDKLRWELTRPYQSILIYNANDIAKFNVADGKVEKLNLGAEDLMRGILKQIISWIQGDFDKAADIYDLKIFKGEKYKLVLTPKSDELTKSIQSIEMVFNADLQNISSVQINESGKNYIKIEFLNTMNNIDIDKLIFNINHPLIVKYPNH
jgi:outer membrane lipoprotein-sorting protein